MAVQQPVIKLFSILVIFAAFPYLLYLYKLLPDTETWETVLGTFQSGYFKSIRYFGYYVLDRVVPLAGLCIVFIVIPKYWNLPLISWIAFYVNRLMAVLMNEFPLVDEYEFIYSLPVTIAIIVALVIIRRKAKIAFYHNEIKSTINDIKEKLK